MFSSTDFAYLEINPYFFTFPGQEILNLTPTPTGIIHPSRHLASKMQEAIVTY